MSPQAVLTKADFYKRWHCMEFGNRVRAFTSLEEANGCPFLAVRYKEADSPWMRYAVPAREVEDTVEEFVLDGARRDLFTFNESAPDSKLLIQGEIARSTRHYEAVVSDLKLPMRKALERKSMHLYGIIAKGFVQAYCDSSSFEDIMCLLDLYPDHVVEFGVYNTNLGWARGRNTVIWEVRKY